MSRSSLRRVSNSAPVTSRCMMMFRLPRRRMACQLVCWTAHFIQRRIVWSPTSRRSISRDSFRGRVGTCPKRPAARASTGRRSIGSWKSTVSIERMQGRPPVERASPVARTMHSGLAEGASDTSALLRGAADRVANATADVDAEMRRHIGLVLGAVAQATAGQVPSLGILPSYAPARRLLDALRSEYLNVASESPQISAAALLAELRGIETVRGALDADAAQRLAARIASPDELETI